MRFSCAQAKPDMIAFKELKNKLTPKDYHGHPPGLEVVLSCRKVALSCGIEPASRRWHAAQGAKLNGKGELAILGIHKQIVRGIDAKYASQKPQTPWRTYLMWVTIANGVSTLQEEVPSLRHRP